MNLFTYCTLPSLAADGESSHRFRTGKSSQALSNRAAPNSKAGSLLFQQRFVAGKKGFTGRFVNSLAFLSDSNHLLTPAADDAGTREGTALSIFALDGSGSVRDVPGPAPGRPVQYNRAIEFALSPLRDELAVITSLLPDQPVSILDTTTWEKCANLSLPKGLSAFNVAWAPDGETITVSFGLGQIALFDRRHLDRTAQTFLAFPPPPTTSAQSLAFSPDGNLLALGAGLVIGTPAADNPLASLRLWPRDGSALVASLAGRYEPVRGLSWHGDGRRIALACGDKTLRLLAMGATPSINVIAEEKFEGVVYAVEFSPNGRRLAAAIGNSVMIFDSFPLEIEI